MIPSWIKSLLGLGERFDNDREVESIGSKLRGLENMKRINEAILSGTCEPHQLAELEVGAETITLNLKKSDTDKTRKTGGGK